MTPVEEIIPGFKLSEEEMVIYAKDQPEYIPLPAWKGPDGQRVTRWKLTFLERLEVFLGGSIWLTILTFSKPLQPVKLETRCPIFGHIGEDEEV